MPITSLQDLEVHRYFRNGGRPNQPRITIIAMTTVPMHRIKSSHENGFGGAGGVAVVVVVGVVVVVVVRVVVWACPDIPNTERPGETAEK